MYIPLTFEGALSKCIFATAVSGAMEGYFISGSQQWKYHWFTGSGNLVVDKGTIDNVQIYVVGGGGGGATANPFGGGGGGGGGAVTYTMNGRLFAGTYSSVIGAGGESVNVQDTAGTNGRASTFIGNNINMSAGGGQGGGQGGNIGTGGAAGGAGGGAGGAGGSSTCSNGSIGTLIYFAGQNGAGYGCGGGGATSVFTGGDCFSCNDTSYGGAPGGYGANRYGMGGAGGNNPGYPIGGFGGSGSVMIQYPIYDYCNNYFNETGSCGCKEITFDTTDPFNYYPNQTGSYLYMPCGEDNFVSGSLIAYAPLIVCAVSNSYYSYVIGDTVEPLVPTVRAGFVNDTWLPNAPQCVSASITPTTCSVEWFAPTCTSSIVTIYTPSGSGGNPSEFGYVAKNATTHSIYTSTSARVNYFCISTGSLYGGNQIYPQLLTGNYAALYNTASCNTIELQASWAGKTVGAGNTTYYYYACNGEKTSVTLSRPTNNFTGTISASFCRDMITPTYFVRSGIAPTEYLYTGSVCLGANFNTGSCGCP
jgi:hypothetical protein